MRWSAFVTLWLLVLPAVAAAETRIDISPSANFSRFKTYKIEVNPPIRYGQVDEDDTITENRLRRVVDYQLRLHGLTANDAAPDVIVKVSRREWEQTELVGTGPGYPWGWYGPWGYGYGGYWGAPYVESRTVYYNVATIQIDLLDGKDGKLVWRGSGAKTVYKTSPNPAEREAEIREAVQKVLAQYPPH